MGPQESVARTLGRGLLIASGLAFLTWVAGTEQGLAGGGPFAVAEVTPRLAIDALVIGLGVALASRGPVEGDERRGLAGILGGALLRGALTAGLLAVYLLSQGHRWPIAVPGICVGLCAAPAAFVEGLARRRPPSWTRDLVAALAVAVVALVSVFAAHVQNEYTLGVIGHGSLAAAVGDVSAAVRGTASHPRLLFELCALPAVPFAALALASLRGFGAGARALFVPAATCLAILPTMDLAGIGRPFPVERFVDFPTFSCFVPSCEAFLVALVVPLAALLAERLSSRLSTPQA